eukprot:6069722-Amphidinium_carterae.1
MELHTKGCQLLKTVHTRTKHKTHKEKKRNDKHNNTENNNHNHDNNNDSNTPGNLMETFLIPDITKATIQVGKESCQCFTFPSVTRWPNHSSGIAIDHIETNSPEVSPPKLSTNVTSRTATTSSSL